MNAPMQFLASPLAHALLHSLGWTLLHFCWQGTIVAAVLWAVLELLAGRSSQARYAASCVALLLLVALPVITFAHLASTDLRAGYAAWNSAVDVDFTLTSQASAASPSAPWHARLALTLDRRMPWLLALWLLGAIFFVVRLNYGLLVARRLQSRGTELPSAELLQVFDELRLRLRVSRAIRLLHSARVQVPTVIGWLRPVVLIPASCLTGLSPEQIEAIFCHELAHVRRHDYLVSVFQSVAEALLFYHPAVWWVSRQVRRERECCCDEIAVANGGNVLAYARALSSLEESRASFPEFVLGANGGVLSMRIRRLLGYKADSPLSQAAALTLLALMFAISCSYAVNIAKAESKAAPLAAGHINPPVHATRLAEVHGAQEADAQLSSPPSAQPSVHGIYKTWLDEDVLYIITPPERTAFLNLANDEERDRFIDQFWARRDLPGSTPGAFREEHYARIAYANQHFASDTTVGWKSDRGRIYIVYGKPNSLDSHPSGDPATNTPPFEIWHYRALGDGKQTDARFVDAAWDGNYRLESSTPISQTGTPPDIRAGGSTPGMQSSVPTLREVHYQGLNAMTISQVVDRLNRDGIAPQIEAAYDANLISQAASDMKKMLSERGYGNAVVSASTREMPSQGVAVLFAVREGPSSGTEYNGLPIRKIGPGVSPPVPILQVEPEYSAEARQAKFNGIVIVALIVDHDGMPQDVHVLRGVGMGLDEKAVEAVRQYRFKPAIENGEPVPVALNVEVNFQIFDRPQTTANAAANSSPAAHSPAFVYLYPGIEQSGPPVKEVGGAVSAPTVIHSVPPEYTPEARKAKVEGIVAVMLIVDEHGLPQDVQVVRGTGTGLDMKAVEAIRQYRFKPALEDGRPVRVRLNIEVNFKIF